MGAGGAGTSSDAVRVALVVLNQALGGQVSGLYAGEPATVHRVARRLRGRVVPALHQLAGNAAALSAAVPLVAGFDREGADGGRGYFGPRGPSHGLGVHPHYFAGFDALEAHYTKTLARMLSPRHAGPAAVERARSFATALFEAAGQPVPAAITAMGADLSCEAEVELPRRQNRRRIDVLLRWSDDAGQPHCLAVEAKFGAAVRDGTLAAYRGHCLKLAGARERLHLFLVANAAMPAVARRNREWRQASWLAVLRRWERRLAALPAANDDAFLHFRAALWRRAAERR